MIIHPTQRQIDVKHPKDLVVVHKKSKLVVLLTKIIDLLTNYIPEYVYYKGKQYDNRRLIIYTKEEVASMRSEQLKATIGKSKNIVNQIKYITADGNINRVLFNIDDYTASFEFNELKTFLNQIELAYQTAIDNQKQFDYTAIKVYKLSEFETETEIYKFKNGIYLTITIAQDNKTKNYVGMEQLLMLETNKEQYVTPQDATKALNEIIVARLHIIDQNKDSYALYDKEIKEIKEKTDE